MTPPNAKAVVNRRLGGGEAMTPSLPRSPRNDLAATKETPSKVAQREDKLVRVATLLGTYSLGAQGGGGGEGSPSVPGRSGAGSGGEKDAVARCSASALRALLCGPSSSTSSSSRGDDSGTKEEDRSRPRPPPSEPSSFPSLMLDSDPHHHHHHHHAPYSEDKREVEVLASSNLARPVLLLSSAKAVPVPVPASFSSRKAPTSGTNSSQVSCGTTHDSADKSTTARDSAVKSDKSNANQSDDTAGRSTDGAEDFKNTALRRSTDSVAETTVDFKEDNFGRQDTVNNTSGHEPNPSRGVSLPDGTPLGDSCSGAGAAALTDPASIPPLLLRNLCSSFALLVGARLRAYGTILAGHAASMLEGTDGGDLTPDDCDDDYGGDGDRPTTPTGEDGDNVVGSEEEEEEEEEQYKEGGECSSCLGAAETKLTALVKIGEGVGVDAAVTAMRASTAAACQRKADDGDKRKVNDNAEANADDEAVRLPLTFEAVVDVGVPNLVEGRRDVLSVSIEAPGTIEGNFLKVDNDDGARLSSVRVELDTHILLASMIERACEVVARAVENVAAAAAVAASSPCALEVHRAKEEEGVDKDADACNEDRDASSPKNNDAVDGDGDENDAADRAAMPPPEPRAPSVVSPDLRALIPAKRSRAENAASAADDDAGRDPSPLDLLDGPSAPTPSSEEAVGAEVEDEDSSERCAAIVDYIMEEVVDACPSWLKNPFPPCKRARRGSGSRPAMPAPAQAQE